MQVILVRVEPPLSLSLCLSLFWLLLLLLRQRAKRPRQIDLQRKEKTHPHRGEAGPLGRETPPHKKEQPELNPSHLDDLGHRHHGRQR